ncbi:MAG: hypothetical protein VB011_09975 [Bacteroidales bacterium]|jgi:hypothetical protein|nr:hypothetical protein [Bacteroidales bacterium]
MELESLNNSKFALNNQEMKQILGGEIDRSKCKWNKDCEGTYRPIYGVDGCVNLDGTLVSITYYGPTDGEIASGTSADSYVTNCTDAANCRGN